MTCVRRTRKGRGFLGDPPFSRTDVVKLGRWVVSPHVLSDFVLRGPSPPLLESRPTPGTVVFDSLSFFPPRTKGSSPCLTTVFTVGEGLPGFGRETDGGCGSPTTLHPSRMGRVGGWNSNLAADVLLYRHSKEPAGEPENGEKAKTWRKSTRDFRVVINYPLFGTRMGKMVHPEIPKVVG